MDKYIVYNKVQVYDHVLEEVSRSKLEEFLNTKNIEGYKLINLVSTKNDFLIVMEKPI